MRCSAAVLGTLLCMTSFAVWNTPSARSSVAVSREGSAASGVPFHLRCEFLENPLGIDKSSPQLSWQIGGQDRDWQQAAYQVFVATSESLLRDGKADVWDSGRVPSGQSVGIFYGGPQLQSERRYFWKVRVWDSHGQASDSSESAWWEMGLLAPNDWKARWISWEDPDSERDRASIQWIWVAGQDALTVAPTTVATFRTKITLGEKPFEAALMVAVRGAYTATVNGREVGRKSRWTTFDWRDITNELVAGDNAIEIKVTAPSPQPYGPSKDAKSFPTAVAALVKVISPDGVIKRYATAENWQAQLESAKTWSPAQVVGELSHKQLGDPGPLPERASCLRKVLELPDKVESARLFVTALGSYRFLINGERVSKDVLTPEFTDYRKRLFPTTVKGIRARHKASSTHTFPRRKEANEHPNSSGQTWP